VETEFATIWWQNGGKVSKYSTNFPPLWWQKVEISGIWWKISLPLNGGIMVEICLNTPPIFHHYGGNKWKQVASSGK
jgi:hypothetical protein